MNIIESSRTTSHDTFVKSFYKYSNSFVNNYIFHTSIHSVLKRDAKRINGKCQNLAWMQQRWNCRIKVKESTIPKTKVGQFSIREVRPFRKIWWRNNTVPTFKNTLFASSWLGGFFELAALLTALKKQLTSISISSVYSSSPFIVWNANLKWRKFILSSSLHLRGGECVREV